MKMTRCFSDHLKVSFLLDKTSLSCVASAKWFSNVINFGSNGILYMVYFQGTVWWSPAVFQCNLCVNEVPLVHVPNIGIELDSVNNALEKKLLTTLSDGLFYTDFLGGAY